MPLNSNNKSEQNVLTLTLTHNVNPSLETVITHTHTFIQHKTGNKETRK